MEKLAYHTTFRMGGPPYLFTRIVSLHDVERVVSLSKKKNIPLLILGEGSNVLIPDTPIPFIVGRMALKEYTVLQETSTSAWIRIGAGMRWDDVVQTSIQQGYSGIEALSAIPGTAGATPVQNVGAYGVEIQDVLESVTVFDIDNATYTSLSKQQCHFSYRNSIFKEHPNAYIITSITLKLSKRPPSLPPYQKLIEHFSTQNFPLTSHAIRECVIHLRSRSLPDPAITPNVGSFFKNPIVSQEKEFYLRKMFPSLVSFPFKETSYKLAAGWLIDQCGLKGYTRGHFRTYEKNALVIIHDGHGTFEELCDFISILQHAVKKKFEVTLELEPRIISYPYTSQSS